MRRRLRVLTLIGALRAGPVPWLAAALLAAAALPAGAATTMKPGWTETDRRDFEAIDQAGDRADYPQALALAKALRDRLETEGRAGEPVAADVMDRLVFLSMRNGLGAEPETLAFARRGLAIREGTLGPDDIALAWSLQGLGNVLLQREEYSEARSAYERAVDIADRSSAATGSQRASIRCNFANLLADLGESTRARDLYESALADAEKTLGPDDPGLWQILDTLALVLADMGDLETARVLFERAVGLVEKGHGPDSLDLAIVLDNEADTLFALGENARARDLWTRALRIRESHLGPENLRVAGTLANLAQALIVDREFEEAQAMLERARRYWEKTIGPDAPIHALALDSEGDILAAQGNWQGALPLYERALRLRERGLAPGHPLIARTLTRLARAEAALGDDTGALAAALRAETIVRDHLRRSVRHLSERQALDDETIVASGLDVAQGVLERGTGHGAPASPGHGAAGTPAARVWDALVRSRAQVLDEMAARHRSILAAPGAGTASLVAALDSARSDLAGMLLGRPGDPGSVAEFDARFERVAARVDDLERAIAETSLPLRRDLGSSSAGLAEVARALPPGVGLLSFSQYDAGPGQRGREELRYMAYVLPAAGAPPRAIPLGPSSVLDPLIDAWRAEAGALPADARAASRYQAAASAVARRLWEPVAPLLKRCRTVLVVPEGPIHLVNFAALPARGDRFLLESGPTFQYLSTERDIVATTFVPPAAAGSLLALGGIDFDSAAATAPARAEVGGDPAISAASTIASTAGGASPERTDVVFRGLLPSCSLLASLRFPPLPSTGSEVGEVAALWRSRWGTDPDHGVTVLTGRDAGEAIFKRLAPRHRNLHLATHAVWLGDSCDRGAGAAALRRRLQLSGLALAGANLRPRPTEPSDGEDGILTSEEIASLDLREVDWVVLSGCQTGVGPVLRGEGIFGLRRTFAIAGARTLVLSLWPVADHEARLWMGALYRARLAGRPAAEAVRRASLLILQTHRDAGVTTHPFFWAGFVGAGDWR